MLVCIDIGIKNLSVCMVNTNDCKIIKWGLINLTNFIEENICCSRCNKPSKYIFNSTHFCKRHIEKSIVPDDLLNYDKKTINELKALIVSYNLTNSTCKRKSNILNIVDSYVKLNYCVPYIKPKIKCNSYSMIDLSKNLNEKMNVFLSDQDIEKVIIENQLGQQAVRMMQIQSMVTQYFTCIHPTVNVEYISPSLKLSSVVTDGVNVASNATSAYSDRKKLAIALTLHYLNIYDKDFIEYFKNNKKKDDLADSYLYCIYNFKLI
jgi:hypothetical protein